jgi:hypothetical protein
MYTLVYVFVYFLCMYMYVCMYVCCVHFVRAKSVRQLNVLAKVFRRRRLDAGALTLASPEVVLIYIYIYIILLL